MITKNLSKKEKIELIKNLASGKIHVINGEIISGGVVLIKNGEDYYLNDKLVDYEKVRNAAEVLIILPAKVGDIELEF